MWDYINLRPGLGICFHNSFDRDLASKQHMAEYVRSFGKTKEAVSFRLDKSMIPKRCLFVFDVY